MKLRATLVVVSCLLSVILSLLFAQQLVTREVREMDERMAKRFREEFERMRGELAKASAKQGSLDISALATSGNFREELERIGVALAKASAKQTDADISAFREEQIKASSKQGGPYDVASAPRAAGSKVVIGLSMDTLQEERWQRDRDMFVTKARELGAEVEVLDANSDSTRQIQQVKSILSKGVNTLVIIPRDAVVMAEGVRLAHEKGVKVLAYDRLIRNCDLDLYVTFDNVRVGEAQAGYIAAHLAKAGGGKKRIVRIYGAETDNNAFLFKEGQDNVLKPLIASGALEVVHEQHADGWTTENAKKIMAAALIKTKEIDYVLASNDGTAAGAIQALTEAGLEGKVIVTGQDAELVACQRIANGTQAMTIYKPLARLATRAAELSVGLARGEMPAKTSPVDNGKIKVPSVLLDFFTVTKENLRETVIADGFHKENQVFAK